MNKVDFMIKKLMEEHDDISETLKTLSQTDYVKNEEVFNSLSEKINMLSEKFSCSVREFCQKTYSVSRNNVYQNAAEAQGIEVHKEGNQIVIDLPFLLPKKKGKDVRFIGDPLRHQFEKLSETEKLKFNEKVVICIVHMYNNESVKARCYDYDNLESKRILDVITSFTMVDDSPKYCDVYHTSKLCDKDKTRIFVMPEKEFLT